MTRREQRNLVLLGAASAIARNGLAKGAFSRHLDGRVAVRSPDELPTFGDLRFSVFGALLRAAMINFGEGQTEGKPWVPGKASSLVAGSGGEAFDAALEALRAVVGPTLILWGDEPERTAAEVAAALRAAVDAPMVGP